MRTACWVVIGLGLWVGAGSAARPRNCALALDGSGDYVTIPHSPALDFEGDDDFTVECWFQTDEAARGNPPDCALVEKWGGREYRYPYVIRVHVNADRADYGTVEVASFDGSSRYPHLNSARRGLNDGQWHHVAFVRHGTDYVRLYVDGKLEGELTAGLRGGRLGNTCPLCIGHHGDWPRSGPRDFVGLVDEVRVWKVPRSEEALVGNMNRRLTGREPGLVGYWDLNEGAGTVAHDRSGWGLDGQLVGNPQWAAPGAPLGGRATHPNEQALAAPRPET